MDGIGQGIGALLQQRGEVFLCGCEQQFAIGQSRTGIDLERESAQRADMLAFHQNFLVLQTDGQQPRVGPQFLHKYSSPAIDESFSQLAVKRIGESSLDCTGPGGHLIARQDPVGSLCDVGP